MSNNINSLLLGDITSLHFGEQEGVVKEYVDCLLYGELSDFLEENNSKIFKGISREYVKKYMVKFNEMLKINNNTVDVFNNAFEIDYNNDKASEFIGFFVISEGRGDVFGSFPTAYHYSNEKYLLYHTILGNASKVLAKNTDVQFGRVVVQKGSMVEKDVESVVNHDFYNTLIGFTMGVD